MIQRDLLAASDFMMVRADLVRLVGPTEAYIVSRIHWRTTREYAKDSHRWTDGELWWNASMEVIEEETGVPKRTIRRALDRLVEEGHVLREKHQIAGHYDQSYSYRLVTDGSGHIDVAKSVTSDVAKVDTSSSKTRDKKEARVATRIPDPFMLTAPMKEWAASEGITVDLVAETRKFVDYWRARGDKGALKIDWVATWRNWIRNAQERSGGGGSMIPPRPSRDPVAPAPRYPDAKFDDDHEMKFAPPLDDRPKMELPPDLAKALGRKYA